LFFYLFNVNRTEFWPLADVLSEKYRFARSDADLISSFLLPMLQWDPVDRVTAAESLKHPWLQLDYSQP
jgi:serine/threonine-protein kinase SRPK3